MNSEKRDISSSTLNQQYSFIMKKRGNTDASRVIQADFSPFIQKNTGTSMNVFPIYNLDRKPHMPSFILPIDIKRYEQHQNQYVDIHNNKISQVSEEKDEIFVPRPSKKNSCCCICKVIYEDYLTHISNPKHQTALQSSPFNNDINQLCQLFSSKEVSVSQPSTDQEDFNQSPRKKRKGAIKENAENQKNQQSVISSNESEKLNLRIDEQIVEILA